MTLTRKGMKTLHILLAVLVIAAVFCVSGKALADDDVRITVNSITPTELSEAGNVSVTFDVSNLSNYELTNLSLAQGEKLYYIDPATVVPYSSSIQMVVDVSVTDAQLGTEIPFTFGWQCDGEPHTADVSILINRTEDPVLLVERTASAEHARRDETVVFTYTLKNNTKFDITDIVLTDPQVSTDAICRGQTVLATASVTIECPVTLTEKDILSSPEATYFVNGKAKSLSGIAPITVKMVYPEISIQAEAGDTTALGTPFTISVANTGNMDLTGISVKDEAGTILFPEPFSLHAGESRVLSYTIPNPTEDVRNVHFTVSGTDEYGDTCQGALLESIPVRAFVEDSQIQVSMSGDLSSDWTPESGSVIVYLSIVNNSTTPLSNAVLTETSLGTVATYENLPNGQTVFESEIYVGSPRNLFFSLQATDRSGNTRTVANTMVQVAYTSAEVKEEPTGTTTNEGLGSGLFGSSASRVLLILGAVIIIALAALLILTILERSHNGNRLFYDDEAQEDLDEIDRIFNLPPGRDYSEEPSDPYDRQDEEESYGSYDDYDDYADYYYEPDEEDEAPEYEKTIVMRKKSAPAVKHERRRRHPVYEEPDEEEVLVSDEYDDLTEEEPFHQEETAPGSDYADAYSYSEGDDYDYDYDDDSLQKEPPRVIKIKNEPAVRTDNTNKIRRVKPYDG